MPETVHGELIIPADAVPGLASGVVELRDVALMDAPAPLVATLILDRIVVTPGGTIPFEITLPHGTAFRTLAVRAQIGAGGTSSLGSGDLLTTIHVPVSTEVPVRVPLMRLP